MSFEVNFDGLVGPTHNYAGLSSGNVASMRHRGAVANPREAALQGLAKMRLLHELGLKQAFLPPLVRPSLSALRQFGFRGTAEEMLQEAYRESPDLLRTACSASSMWTANAATIAPSKDTRDGKTHFTPANLVSNVHRSLEPLETVANLKKIFCDPKYFEHHTPLGGGPNLGDEGAANHTRLAPMHGHESGLHVFVYGFSAYRSDLPQPKRFAARQSLEACECVARLNNLKPEDCLFLQQSPAAIDAGVFHNDVIATGNENVYLCHEEAHINTAEVMEKLSAGYAQKFGEALVVLMVPSATVSLDEAIRTYLFNSQLVTLPNGRMAFIAPQECEKSEAVRTYIDSVIASPDNPISQVYYLDLKASMSNGGGPACLRLRVVLDEASWAAVADGVKITEAKLKQLEDWVKQYYRTSLSIEDLEDPAFFKETREAFQALSELIEIPLDIPE